MKKNSLLQGILAVVAVLAIVAALLFPIGDGLVTSFDAIGVRGYDFVFGNETMQLNDPNGAMIAWFVLLLIAAFFGIVGSITGFFGGKVGAFFNFLTGLICLVCAILFFLAAVIVQPTWVGEVSLGWGYIAAGVSSAVAAVIDLFIGGKTLFAKKA